MTRRERFPVDVLGLLYHAPVTVKLKYDRGTLITWETPEVIAPLFTWDDRSQLYRAPGQCYRQVVETLRTHGIKHQDEATEFKNLDLRVSREVEPYLHQTEALAAWKQAGRQGVVVLPTGSGKTFVAQLAMRDTPRSTLICVPTKVLMHQWYSGLLAAFPDANIGLLGDGNKDQTPILIAIYESATIYAEELATRYGLIIFDEVHHLPSDYYRTIATMSLAPYRLGLTATPKRSDGREADLDTLVGPVVYHKTPSELGGGTLADYQEVQIRIRLSATEQARYDELIAQRNEFLWRMHIKLGSPDGWQKFINASGTLEGRKAMLAHREARSIAFGTDGKLRVLEEVLANHPTERTLIFADDNAMVYRISREFFIPVITHHTPVKERHDLLQQFKAGTYRILAASRVLNEGVDVPEASIAVVLSGTATEREHIQRLGRILRKSEGKKAVLYEVVTEGTSEERVSQQRRGEWNSQRSPSVPTATWEDVNAPH